MVTLAVSDLLEAHHKRRKLREISESLSRIDSNYFVYDLINLAKHNPDYLDLLQTLKLSDDDILSYYIEIVMKFPDADLLWANYHYVPASIIYHRPTLFFVHNTLGEDGSLPEVIRVCHRYFLNGCRGAVRNAA